MVRTTLAARTLESVKNRGVLAWVISAGLIAFYWVLYFSDYPREGYTAPIDAFAARLFAFLPESVHAGRWTLYGFLYSVAMTLGGAWVIYKYRHNRYQVVRTSVVVFFQIVFGFTVPILLKASSQPEYYFSYFWPLKFDYFQPSTIASQPLPFILWSFIGSLVLVPVLTLLYGKRWYCSWVCGCGGLANTFGEPWRHLTPKSRAAWRFEKVSIHLVLTLALLVTASYALGAFADLDAWPRFQAFAQNLQKYYGIIVLSVLSGVLGTGLYPLGGTRVWCRNFCPMAALLGLIQKLGRFRIRVKKDMCISCGMCSNYCEMGIDVRAYAQANQSFTRAACVGCGLCAEVCPRGVLRLENVRRRDAQELDLDSFVHESWKG